MAKKVNPHQKADLAVVNNALASIVRKQEAEITRLRERLEVDDSHPYDGIYARDETIRLQDAEIARLRAGGCARDQGMTQYCAEAARLAEENATLRAALEAWDYAVRVNLTMEGPSYAGVSSGYGKKAWELTRAALEADNGN